jgi:carboxylesterase type B
MYTYAYPEDPLVAGFIAQSGVANFGVGTGGVYDPTGSNFTYVAWSVGCGDLTNQDAIFECMQKADATALVEVYNKYNATLNGGKSLSFTTLADNQTRHSNYADLQDRGLFARIPTIYSSCNNEGASLVSFNPAGVNQTEVDTRTLSLTTCPGASSSASRAKYGVPVWRIRYFGVWPNLNPFTWLGTYHSSDIPMIFGTSDLRGPDTAAEVATSKYYQAAWAAFAKDPTGGLVKYRWPTYDPAAKTLVELGLNGSTTAAFNDPLSFDGLC